MNKIGFLSVVMGLCVATVVRAQGVAILDMEELVRLHPNTVSDKKLLDQTLKEYKSEGSDLQQKLESLQDAFEKARKEAVDPALSERARKTAEETAAKAREELSAADRKARDTMQLRQQQLNEQEMRMLKRTTAEIREAVEKYATENKLSLVLPINQVVYGDKALDITDAIMKRLNIKRPGKSVAAGAVVPAAATMPAIPAAPAKPAAAAQP